MKFCNQIVNNHTYYMLYVTKLEFKTPNIQEQIANYEKQYKKYFSVIVEGNEPYYETFKNMLYSHIK